MLLVVEYALWSNEKGPRTARIGVPRRALQSSSMNLELRTHRLVRVLLDFDLTIEFSDGSTIAFSEVVVGDELIDEDNQFEGLRKLAAFVGVACERSAIDASGAMLLEFGGAAAISAQPRGEVESWEVTTPDGVTSVCMPGGTVESWPATVPDALPVRRSPTADCTAVRISVGTSTSVDFSDGSTVDVELCLDDAYLVLRESVVAVVRDRVTLSSGYILVCL